MRDAQFSSKAYGTREYKEITIDGRIQFDLLVALQRDHKLSSYSLNAVSAHFLVPFVALLPCSKRLDESLQLQPACALLFHWPTLRD